MLELINGDSRLLVDPERGGRIASLTIAGVEVMVRRASDSSPVTWGSFPMAPWAGRIRNGEFFFEGTGHALVINHPPHAMHGTVFERAWTVAGPREIGIDLGPDWPFGGRVLQRFALTPTRLQCRMELHAAEQPMPGYVGWHPCFVRPDSFEFEATAMYVRDAEGIPDGTLCPVPSPPWDDCFVGVSAPIVLRWGELEVRVSSDCDYWVIYDGQAEAMCVEPQSGPPDGFNLAPSVVLPGKPLIKRMTWDWAALT